MIGPYFTEAELARARALNAAQPPPPRLGSTPVWPLVVEAALLGGVSALPKVQRLVAADMVARDEFGRAKYRQPLTVECGRDFLVDAYQEALDQAVYLRAAVLDPANMAFIGKLATLCERCFATLLDLRRMIAERDGEL